MNINNKYEGTMLDVENIKQKKIIKHKNGGGIKEIHRKYNLLLLISSCRV